MNDTRYNRLIEAGSIVVGLAGIVGLLWLVQTGRTTLDTALPIVLGILGALGAWEGGRRKGKRDAGRPDIDVEQLLGLRDDVLALLDSLDSSDSPSSDGSASESTSAGENTGSESATVDEPRFATTSISNSGQTGTPASHDAATRSPAEQAQRRIDAADYGTLRQVAARVDGARGAGEGNTAERMRTDLATADAEAVLAAFRSLSDGSTDTSG